MFIPNQKRHGRFAFLALTALFSSTTAQAQPLTREEHSEVFARGANELESRKVALANRAAIPRTMPQAVTLQAMKGKGASAMKLSFVDASGRKSQMLLRVPGRGTRWGTRANDTVARLAAQLGEPGWVPAGILADAGTFAGVAGVGGDPGKKHAEDVGKIMVTEFVDRGFKDGEDAPIAWLQKIPEHKRLKAAVLDVLSRARDRKLANVMVNEEGELRLIDHDVTFGMKEEKGPHFPSAFWKGQSLGYTSKQARFEDLPDDVRKVVQAIAEAHDVKSLAQTYPLGRDSSLEVLRTMAAAIMKDGLDAAVTGIVTETQQRGFYRADDTPNAARLLAR